MEKILERLIKLYSENESFPNCCYVFGQKSVGKSMCVEKYLENSKKFLNSVIISADECYSNKILFDNIINTFNNHVLSEENNYESFAKVDTMEEFLNELSMLNISKSYVIVIEKAEKLRDMDINIVSTLIKLQELTGLNISCIFISHIALEKLSIGEVIEIHVPDFKKTDIIDIFLSHYSKLHEQIMRKIEICSSTDDNEKMKQIEAAKGMDEEFYRNYLNIFLNVFYKACRDLKELSFLSQKCYSTYYAPVLSGEIRSTDVTNLWRNVTKSLKISLGTIYMRIGNVASTEIKSSNIAENEDIFEIRQRQSSIKTFAQMLELPFYAKYLLIASFLASHNDAKSDKKLFMKHHGKERKRKAISKVMIENNFLFKFVLLKYILFKFKVVEKMNVQFGPKSFNIDRLLAIFYAILDEKVGLTCNLLSQISTLVDLNFLTFSSGENNIIDGTARLQSTIGLDFAINIGKLVGFNVKQYLTDYH